MPEQKLLKVFLCHSSQDKPAVRELCQRLRAEGWIDPWLDEEKLLPGQDWDLQIEKAVEAADAVIVFMSNRSVNKEGYVQAEVRMILRMAMQKPEEAIFIIPLRLDDCPVPFRLRSWQYVDYFPKGRKAVTYQRLLESLRLRARALGLPAEMPGTPVETGQPALPQKAQAGSGRRPAWFQPPAKQPPASVATGGEVNGATIITGDNNFVLQAAPAETSASPAGGGKEEPPGRDEKKPERRRWIAIAGAGVVFLLTIVLALTGQLNPIIYRPVDMKGYFVPIPAGEFQMGSENGGEDEKPVHGVYLEAFEIGRYEVTNRQYAQCVSAGVCVGMPDAGEDRDLHPVVNVSWHDAQTFCEWAGGRLPTEAEWEKAARGGLAGKAYPWGDEAPICTAGASNAANFGGGSCPRDSMPVGSFAPNGYGLYDMAGNVWEWAADWYDGTYYQDSPSSNPLGPSSGEDRVLRGGSWYGDDLSSRSANRYGNHPSVSYNYLGFRCARSRWP